MKFGVTLRNLNRGGADEMREFLINGARAADDLGFFSVWVGDHLLVPLQRASNYPYSSTGTPTFTVDFNSWECLTVMAGLATVTHRIRLGCGVLIVPLRHPIHAAKIIATLDCLSAGRIIVGIGVGWLKEEMDVLGVPTWEHRGSLTDEYVRAYKELWVRDTPNFSGRWCQFSGFTFGPRPVQRPHPPVWVGGTSDAALRRVVRSGNGWHAVGLTPEEAGGRIGTLRRLCEQQGRDFRELECSLLTNIVLDVDAKGTGGAEFVRQPNGHPIMRGNPDQIASTLHRYQEQGVTHLTAHYTTAGSGTTLERLTKALEIMASQVIPQVC